MSAADDKTTPCVGRLLRRCSGRMRPWRGTDGHGGTELFYTCDRCGRTT